MATDITSNHTLSTHQFLLVDPETASLSSVSSVRAWRDKLKDSVTPVTRKAIANEFKQKLSLGQWQETQDEDLYERKGCWCQDCPWLIAYGITALVWIILMIITWKKSHLTDGVLVSLDDSRCMLLCSQLVPPTRPLDEPKASKKTFHCRVKDRFFEKWEGDIFEPWESKVDTKGNKNCVQDCMNFDSWTAFIETCVLNGLTVEERLIASFFHTGNVLVYVDSIQGHWHWIVHVILITNAMSLFILILPLFFCNPMVACFAVTSVVTSTAVTFMMWWDLKRHIDKLPAAQEQISGNLTFKWTATIASTLFTGYVIFNAFMVFMTFNITGATAALASTVLDTFPTVLLEAVTTMVKLFLLIVLILYMSLAIESSAPLYIRGSEFFYYSSPFTWVVRIYTLFFAYWTAQQFINCQTIVVHGVTARNYFEKGMKNKVITSHKRLLQYHLCTACFAGLLFNWLYWVRWIHRKTPIRSRSLFGTGAFGACFGPASKTVLDLVFTDKNIRNRIDRANPYFFLLQIIVVTSIAIVCGLVFSGPYSVALWPDLFMVCYSYFVSLSVVNIYRVTKDATFLCFILDKKRSRDNPDRRMIIPDPVAIYFGQEPQVSPR